MAGYMHGSPHVNLWTGEPLIGGKPKYSLSSLSICHFWPSRSLLPLTLGPMISTFEFSVSVFGVVSG